MGREHHSSVFSFESKKCACSVYASAKSCCKDEREIVKIDSDQSASQIVHPDVPQFVFIADVFSFTVSSDQIEMKELLAEERQQPPPKVPIYQSVCSLVFYDSLV
jgi:hypothetical protein